MNNERFGELVGTSVATGVPATPEQVASVLTTEERLEGVTNEELLQAVKARGLNLGEVATVSTKELQPSSPETPAPVDVFSTLTPEQQERAGVLQTALAEKFSTEEVPLNPEDFGVVAVGEGENRTVAVMLTKGNGLYKGSYNAIMDKKRANKAAYMVEVDGKQIDTQEAMNWDLYQAFIEQAEADGVNPLPDSEALAKENDEVWTATWLTGEEPDEFGANYGRVYGGEPHRSWDRRDFGWRRLRVRPAAVV